ncbi:MAG TPA: helix-turn-helix transcriptional regulator [Marmoricola sp.]
MIEREVDNDFPELLRTHAEALAAGDGGGLESAAGRFAEAGELLYAAQSAAQSARAYRSAGLRGPASRAAAASQRILSGCEGARTPAASLDIATAELSRREIEVARLVAKGLTNSDIAERLSLSVRTVESHVYRVFAKLGVAQRSDVAAALDGQIQ